MCTRPNASPVSQIAAVSVRWSRGGSCEFCMASSEVRRGPAIHLRARASFRSDSRSKWTGLFGASPSFKQADGAGILYLGRQRPTDSNSGPRTFYGITGATRTYSTYSPCIEGLLLHPQRAGDDT